MAEKIVTVENGEKIDEVVEVSKGTDETTQEDSQKDDTTIEGSENEETESEVKTEDKEEAKFQKRFTQLKGETPDEYLKNLEEAYANSSTEGQRNAKRATDAETKFQQVAQLVATDPEFAAKLNGATDENAPKPILDPALQWAKNQMEEGYKKDYTAFADLHPEIVSDPDLYGKVVSELDIIAAAHEARGSKLTMAEGLRKAWISLGLDESDKKENVMNEIKDQASASSTQSSTKKPQDKQSFTPEQIAVAAKMGLTPKQLAEYNK